MQTTEPCLLHREIKEHLDDQESRLRMLERAHWRREGIRLVFVFLASGLGNVVALLLDRLKG